MDKEDGKRSSGIDIVGTVTWGSHLCLFYKTKQDLLDVLVPYFKEGLLSNEYCMWITSEPLQTEEAELALRQNVPHFDSCLAKEQIKIIPYDKWYLKDGVFDSQRVLNDWVSNHDLALAKGFEGLRLTGNTFWLETKDWEDFHEYERQINSKIGQYKMIALCTYSLDKCGASELVDVIQTHQFAITNRYGKWELIETSVLAKTRRELSRAKEELERRVDERTASLIRTNSILVDEIEEHKASKKKLARQNRMYSVLSAINEAIIRSREPMQLFNQACEIAVEQGRLRMAWVGLVDPVSSLIKPVANYGFEEGYLEKVKISIDEKQHEGRGPSGTAFRNGEHYVVNDIENDPNMGPWRNEALGRGYRSSAAFPLKNDNKIIGTINFYADKTFYFDEEEVYMLDQLANDMSFWIKATEAESQQRQTEQKYAQIVTTAREGIWTIDAQNNTVLVNDAMAKMLAYSQHEMSGRSVFDFMDEESIETAEANIGKGRRGIAETIEVKFRRKDGSEVWTSLITSPLLGTHGRYAGTLAMATDITERREQDKKIRFMAFHDVLTGLPNRVLFDQQMIEELDRAKADKSAVGLLVLDLDNFKSVKNTIGSAGSDKLLKLVVGRVKNLLKEGDSMARIGEDEFFILLPHIATGKGKADNAINQAEKVISLFSRPWRVDGREINTMVNIGLSYYPKDGKEIRTLQGKADVAMLRAKNELGPNSFEPYQASMKGLHNLANARLDIESRLSNALEQNEFELYYQPVLTTTTKEIAYAEALIRWNNSKGLLSPLEFIPIAEETGQIRGIGQWVLSEICRKHRDWLDKGLKIVKTTVNLSPKQFQQPNLVPSVAHFLETSGVDPHNLGIEITESAIMIDPARSVETMHKLKQLGLSLHLDDFGTGYSSLSYIKQFPLDEIKLDMSFIVDLATDVDSVAIVNAMIMLSHGIGLRVTAEGVETKKQYEQLKALGCDYVQGFFLSKPLSASDFEKCLDERAKAA